MLKNKQSRKAKNPWLAYAGYLFQSFLKRPFGYIVAILYVVYLAVILLIVPSVLHFEPLFIWNVGGFNMPIFNLYFIAAMAASIAVAVFRTSRDDGMELNLAAKPLTKGTLVGIKTIVYLLIMLIVSLLSVVIVALIKPIFGQYDELTNITGIQQSKYISLLLSVFVGNTVNMLLFGGIAVFISMVGGQVIIMIGTIGIVFLMCLMNFIFPQVIKSATDVLSDKYDTEILSYSCNTLGQVVDPTLNSDQKNFATIQCVTDDDGIEDQHYDTYEYWTKASQESGRQAVNYIDLGKQLSSLYSSFGLDDSKLKEASKLVIGTNAAYNYKIDPNTHITDATNLEMLNYPISYYGMVESQGKKYPAEIIVGGDMSLSTNNWYARAAFFQVDFNSVIYISNHPTGITISDEMRSTYGKAWFKLKELYLTNEEWEQSWNLFSQASQWYVYEYKKSGDASFVEFSHKAISEDDSGVFFTGNYDDLTHPEKAKICAKILLSWSYLSSLDQIEEIQDWYDIHQESVTFPFSTKVIQDWHAERAASGKEYEAMHHFNLDVFNRAIWIESLDPEKTDDGMYCKLVTSQMSYAETFSNLYEYHVTSFYNLATIIAVWSIVSGMLFAGSVIVYKRTDFK